MAEQAMTRCECTGLTFRAIHAIADREGIDDLAFLCRRTGCAATCTACRPDLESFLKAAGKADHPARTMSA